MKVIYCFFVMFHKGMHKLIPVAKTFLKSFVQLTYSRYIRVKPTVILYLNLHNVYFFSLYNY